MQRGVTEISEGERLLCSERVGGIVLTSIKSCTNVACVISTDSPSRFKTEMFPILRRIPAKLPHIHTHTHPPPPPEQGCIQLFAPIASRLVTSLLTCIKWNPFDFCQISVTHIISDHQLSLKMNDLCALCRCKTFVSIKCTITNFLMKNRPWHVSDRSNFAACLHNGLKWESVYHMYDKFSWNLWLKL